MVTRVARAIDSLSHMCIYHLTSVMVLCAWRCEQRTYQPRTSQHAGLPGLIYSAKLVRFHFPSCGAAAPAQGGRMAQLTHVRN